MKYKNIHSYHWCVRGYNLRSAVHTAQARDAPPVGDAAHWEYIDYGRTGGMAVLRLPSRHLPRFWNAEALAIQLANQRVRGPYHG